MIGKIIPYIAIGMLQLALILVVGHLLFRVPMRGSVVDLYLAVAAFIAASLALGLLISTVAKTQFQAMQMTIFLILPSILLSGFVFPFDGMPVPAQQLAEVLPLTHFVRMVRGIILRGASLADVSRGDLDLGDLESDSDRDRRTAASESAKDLIERLKTLYGEQVADVRVSTRLVSSPACISASPRL
mgnify:CR=1 FL=1